MIITDKLFDSLPPSNKKIYFNIILDPFVEISIDRKKAIKSIRGDGGRAFDSFDDKIFQFDMPE